MIQNFINKIGNICSYLVYKKDRLRLRKHIKSGLSVGKNVYIGENVFFDYNYPYLIEIGDNCRITSGTFILAHDATIFRELGVTRIAPVKILPGTFIGANVIILPGVTIGPNAMIAAGSVVNRDIGSDKIAAGNPARPYGSYSDLINKYRNIARTGTIYCKSDIESNKISTSEIKRSFKNNKYAFIQGVPKSDPYYLNSDFKKIRFDANRAFKNITKNKCKLD